MKAEEFILRLDEVYEPLHELYNDLLSKGITDVDKELVSKLVNQLDMAYNKLWAAEKLILNS